MWKATAAQLRVVGQPELRADDQIIVTADSREPFELLDEVEPPDRIVDQPHGDCSFAQAKTVAASSSGRTFSPKLSASSRCG